MKNLYPSKEFAPGIAAALQELIGDRIIEVLPNLQNIFVERLEPSGSIWKNIGQFVAARQLLGRPIVIHLRPFPNSVERLEPSGSVQEDLWRSIAARRPLDRPNAIHPHPPLNSYWANPLLVACTYPWTTGRIGHIDLLLRTGVRTFIDLTKSDELSPDAPHLAAHLASRLDTHETLEYFSFPIANRSVLSVGYLRQILDVLKDNERRGRITAVTSRGGIGRMDLVVGCWLVESGTVEDGAAALKFIAEKRNEPFRFHFQR